MVSITSVSTTNFLGIFLGNKILPLVGVVFYMLAFAIGFGGTMPLFVAEIIPAIGVGISTALQWAAAFIVSYYVPKLDSVLGAQGFIYIFIGCNVFSFILIGITCIETKGLSEAEIAKKYEIKTGNNR